MEPSNNQQHIREPGRRRERVPWTTPLLMSVLGPLLSGVVMFLLLIAVVAFYIKSEERRPDGVDEVPPMKEVWSYGHGTQKVVRIAIKGVLMEDEDGGFFAARNPVSSALRQIRAATADEEVRALLLEIDSPGGGITASDLIYKALQDFKASAPDRKIVAVLGDIAASGGYYVAVAADYIVAHPTTLTGSFSVLISKLNIKGLGDQYGVKLETIKSGANKDLLSPFTDLTEEQRALLQEVVNEMHNRFVKLIADGRPELSVEDVDKLADGRVFTGVKAAELKLVDQVGYWTDAFAKTEELLGIGELKAIRYEETLSLSSLFMAMQQGESPGVGVLARMARTRLMYMWQAW